MSVASPSRAPDRRRATAGDARAATGSWWDGLVVALVAAASTLTYVTRLGFTSDDYDFVSLLALAPDQGLPGLTSLLLDNPNITSRPVQAVFQAGMYVAFGTDELMYQVVGAALLVAMAVLSWACLRELAAPRVAQVAVPVLFALSPAYATDRFFFAAYGYQIAVAAWLASLLLLLFAVRRPRVRWGWRIASLMALAVSALGYEIAVPLLAANPVVAAAVYRRRHGAVPWRRLTRVRAAALLVPDVLVLLGVMAFKYAYAVGVVGGGGLVPNAVDLGLTTLAVNAGSFAALLPLSVAWAAGHAPPEVIALAVAVAGATAAHVWRVVAAEDPGARVWRLVIAAGLAVAVLGAAIFLTTGRYAFTSTGIGTRTWPAVALGMSAVLVGLIGLAASRAPRPRLRRTVTAALVGAVAGGYMLVTGTVGEFWLRADARQAQVLRTVAPALAGWPGGSFFLVDGVCPYEGPAVVFETSWDLRGALRLRTRDPSLSADIVSRRLTPGDSGFQTISYDVIRVDYPYSSKTVFIDAGTGRSRVLTSRADLEEALRASPFEPARDCPVGREARGVQQLVLDRLLGARLP